MKIAVAGGGITGLTFMNYLQKMGADATLFEKRENLNEKGSGILLGINAMKILRKLDLEEIALKKGQVLESISQVYAGGSVLARMETGKMRQETGQYTVCISRPDLHNILSQNISPQKIELGADLLQARAEDSQVSLAFSQKQSGASEFDLVIGADGIFSKTRESFCGKPELRYSGYTCWRFIIEAPENLDLNHAFEFVGLGKRFGVFPQGQNQVYCFATLNAAAEDPRYQDISKKDFCALFGEFPATVAGCLDRLKNDKNAVLIQRDIADLKKSILHVPGLPVIFAGDAGHATTPNMGQGAAMGMEDAHVFAEILAKGCSPQESAKEFDRLRKKRVESIRAQSKLFGKLGQIENPLAAALRNGMMRMIPQEATRKQMQSLLLHSSVFPVQP